MGGSLSSIRQMPLSPWGKFVADYMGKTSVEGMPDSLCRMLKNEHFCRVIETCWDIYDRKGKDYTRGKGDLDRLDNFNEAAEQNGVSSVQAWGVYFYKQTAAVWKFVKDGTVESEPIEGRLHDVINYSILLLLIIKEQRRLAADSTI